MSKNEAKQKFGEIASNTGVSATDVAAIAGGAKGVKGVQPHKLREVQAALFAARQAGGGHFANSLR